MISPGENQRNQDRRGGGLRFGPPEDQRAPLTPQLALRAAVVGSIALGLFAIIFFRLWFLQVLSGQKYVAAATVNRVRDIDIAAPRGKILDATGAVLVDSTRALAVQISPPDLPVPVTLANIARPPQADVVIYNRLAHVLGISTRRRPCTIGGQGSPRLTPIACLMAQRVEVLPYGDVTVKSPVSRYIEFFLGERQSAFRGVQVQQVYVTHYPDGDLAAQVLGTVGPINPSELTQRVYRGVSPNAIIGQSGVESQYDSFLRGTDGVQQVEVNSLGEPTGSLTTKQPVIGHYLKLSLNAKLQAVGQASLAQSIAANPPADAGSFVAMNPQTGAVYAMGSLPSFNPSVFTGNLSVSTYQQLTNPNSGYPLLNRAIQSAGPTGSTFKPITATAAMQSGLWSPGATYDDTGQFCIDGQCRHNAGYAAYGVVDMVSAIKVSDDVFFYHLGALTNADPFTHPNGGPVDHWAHAFGIGRRTGVDLPGEVAGTLPSPRWRAQRNQLEAECDNATGPFRYTNGHQTGSVKLKGWYRSPKHAPGGCGIADGTNRPWSIGDNINLSVGQGDVQVTPLQLAVVYSALENGGTIVRPHLGMDVQTQGGTVLQTFNPGPVRHLAINPTYLDTIRAGLRAAASQQGGTSASVFAGFPEPVYGKTGTAQLLVGSGVDTAWYACYVPASATSKPIVVVVKVERGGFGEAAAAPVARQILSQWFLGKPGPFK